MLAMYRKSTGRRYYSDLLGPVDAGIGTGHKTPCFGYACAALVGSFVGSTFRTCRRPKLLLPVCFRAPQLVWCAPISDGQLAIVVQSLAGLR